MELLQSFIRRLKFFFKKMKKRLDKLRKVRIIELTSTLNKEDDMNIKKQSPDYIVTLDDKTYWVDPQYEVVLDEEGEKVNRPDLIAAVRAWIRDQDTPNISRDIEASVAADKEYRERYDAITKAMRE